MSLKNKIMLAILAGGMMCTNVAFADGTSYWYGTINGFVTNVPNPAVPSGINLTITDSTVDDKGGTVDTVSLQIFGAYTEGTETISGNKITINLNSRVLYALNTIAGYSGGGGNVNENTLIINSGTFTDLIYGGFSYANGNVTGDANENVIEINGGTFNMGSIIVSSGRNAIANKLTISDGNFGNGCYLVVGGGGNNVNENKLTIDGGTFGSGGNYYAGSGGDNVNENELTIDGGTFGSGGSFYGGKSSDGTAYGNIVTISSVIFGAGNQIYGGYSQSGIVESNEVKINGGSVGYVYGGSSVSNDAVGNTVTVNGGIITEGITGGNSGTGNVCENHVVIVNGKVDGYIFGGDTAHGNATSNVVELNGGDINAEVYGGFSNGGGEVKDNTVILNGTDVSDAKIYGYDTTGSHSGNKLEVKQPAVAISVSNFDIINFTLPSGTTDGSKILNASTINLSGTKINVGAVSGLTLNADDTITLIHTTNGITGTFTVGDITLNGNWEIKQDGNDIILVASDEDNPPDDPDDPDNPNPPTPPTPINVDDGYDGSQIIHNLATGSAAEKWCNNIATNQPNADMRQNTINTMTNMEQLANVQHGNYALTNIAMDETFNHMSVRNRNLEYSSMPKYKLRNTAARRGNYRIDQIDVGRVDDVLPTHQLDRIIDGDSRRTSPRTSRYNGYSRNNYNDNYYNNGRNSDRDYYAQRRSYKNYEYISSGGEEEQMVWATYIHSKEEIKDMEVGHLKQDSTLKYNGATVGADLWQSDHGFGGLSVTYAKGDVNSVQKVSSVKNDVDYYGGSIYHRTDSGKFSVQLDATYSNSKNDIKMQTLGAEDIKIKPKTEAYSAGIKIEEPIEINEKTNIVPFIGVRYTHMRTEKTQSNIDIAYGSNEQDMCSVPLGVSLRNQFEVSDSMKLGTVLDAGYIFNIGDRKGKQRLIYGAVTDTVNYNIVDKGQYFIKAAIQAICENMMWELGYHYSKSSKVKDDKWYVNADFKF